MSACYIGSGPISTGLDYPVNRYYSNQFGRFMSPDPYMSNSGGFGDPSNPQSWNRYSYTHDDPVNLKDPRGLLEEGAMKVVTTAEMVAGRCAEAEPTYPWGRWRRWWWELWPCRAESARS